MTARIGFEHSLRALQGEVLVLGNMVDRQLGRAIEALKQLDGEAARNIIQDDLEVNRKRFDIENRAIELIATQQPMASDLRTLVATLIITEELERMGDYAEGIAKIVLLYGNQPLLKPLIDIPRMSEQARGMLRRALTAFMERDSDAARAIVKEDDVVDALYDQVYRELLTYMMQDPRTLDRATWLLWAAHNLERFADRVTNICERVVYEVTGQMEEIGSSKY